MFADDFQFRLVDGFERMDEDAGGQHLQIVLGRAAVGEFGRDHFPLLGHPHASAIEPAGWAAMARPAGAPPRLTEPPRPWKKSTSTPAARPMRISRRCASNNSKLAQKKPPSLFELRVAEHHLLPPAVHGDRSLDHRRGQEIGHDGGGGPQVVDGFEQRHNAEPAGLARRLIREQAAPFGQQIEFQHVAGALRHRQDEGADGLRVRPVEGFADQIQEIEQFAGVIGDAAKLRQEAQRFFQFAPVSMPPMLRSPPSCGGAPSASGFILATIPAAPG